MIRFPTPDFSLTGPTPFASAVSALVLLVAVLLVAQLVGMFRKRRARKAGNQPGVFARIVERIGAFDRGLVRGSSWVTGTRYKTPWIRLPVMAVFFLTLTAASVFAPFPWAFIPVILGLIGILSVFRHAARHEGEFVDEVPQDSRLIQIDGHLHREIILAVSFILVFAPIALAQLQAAGLGYERLVTPEPFTFVAVTLVEALKAGFLVDYYDLWAAELNYARFTGAEAPSGSAKYALMGYRIALNLMLIAAIQSLWEIAQRRAKGLDLRYLEARLKSDDAEDHVAVVAELATFSQVGRRIARLNAVDLLERILQPRDGEWALGPEVKFLACLALQEYGEQYGRSGALFAAVDGYKSLIENAHAREKSPANWAGTQVGLGNALQTLGKMTGSEERVEEAVQAFHAALEVYTRHEMPTDWAATQMNLGNALARLGEMKGSAARVEEALTAYRAALEVYTRDSMPTDWAATQMNLGTALSSLGGMTGSAAQVEEAVQAFRAALEVQTRNDLPADWARTQMSLGSALARLGGMTRSEERMEEAVPAYHAALEVYTRDKLPARWAMTQANLGNALVILGDMTGSAARVKKAVQACRAALEVQTRNELPADWARTQVILGAALSTSGEMTGSAARMEEAVQAYRAALEVYTRDETPADWAPTQLSLGSALQSLGQMTGSEERAQLNLGITLQLFGLMTGSEERVEEAVQAYRAALEVYTRDELPVDWAMTQMKLGTALWDLGQMTESSSRMEEAVQAHRAALEVHTYKELPDDWAMTQFHLGNALLRLGQMTGSEERVEEAVQACRAALKVFARDELPTNWAMTQVNLGTALRTLRQGTGSEERMEEAITAYRAALRVFLPENALPYWVFSTQKLFFGLVDLGAASGDCSKLLEAKALVRQLIEHDPPAQKHLILLIRVGAAIEKLGCTES